MGSVFRSGEKGWLRGGQCCGGAYVPKADLDTKQRELDTANGTIKDLRETAKAWDGKDPKKLEDDLKISR